MRCVAGRTAVLLSLLPLVSESGTDQRTRNLLLPNRFEQMGMAEVFKRGGSITAKLIEALDDRDEAVSCNAQMMLRLIGDEKGIQQLHEWYRRPKPVTRIVNGPNPAPLSEWDYEQIDAMLAAPFERWPGHNSVNYLLALHLDGSPRSQDLIAKISTKVPPGTAYAVSQVLALLSQAPNPAAPMCVAANPTTLLRGGAFFLPPDASKVVTLLAYADSKEKALLRVGRTFGETFLVVLSRVGQCWKFKSVSLYSTNN
jgi:hypothetical protein